MKDSGKQEKENLRELLAVILGLILVAVFFWWVGFRGTHLEKVVYKCAAVRYAAWSPLGGAVTDYQCSLHSATGKCQPVAKSEYDGVVIGKPARGDWKERSLAGRPGRFPDLHEGDIEQIRGEPE